MKYNSYDTIHLIDVYLQGTMAGHGVHCDNISTFTTPLPQVLFASFFTTRNKLFACGFMVDQCPYLFSGKQAQNARFQSYKTSVLSLFSRNWAYKFGQRTHIFLQTAWVRAEPILKA
jgi:hypothetical protein